MEQIDVLCLGEILIDMFPGEVGKRLQDVTSFHPKPGGAPANVAVAASRLGARSAFIGKVGQDHFGHYLADLLAREGVNTQGVRFDPEARTTLAIIAQQKTGAAEFVFYRNPGADQRLRSDELDRELLERSRIFHFGSLSLTNEPSRSATKEAIRIATGAGSLISCDVNYRPALWAGPEQAVSEICSLLAEVDLLKVNQTEAAMLAEMDGLRAGRPEKLGEAASALLDQGPALVVITLGEAGSYFKIAGKDGILVDSFPVESVDSVGCGDAFTAGLLFQISRLDDVRQFCSLPFLTRAIPFANAAGAITSTQVGAIPAMPGLSTVDSFLSQYDQSRKSKKTGSAV